MSPRKAASAGIHGKHLFLSALHKYRKLFLRFLLAFEEQCTLYSPAVSLSEQWRLYHTERSTPETNGDYLASHQWPLPVTYSTFKKSGLTLWGLTKVAVKCDVAGSCVNSFPLWWRLLDSKKGTQEAPFWAAADTHRDSSSGSSSPLLCLILLPSSSPLPSLTCCPELYTAGGFWPCGNSSR